MHTTSESKLFQPTKVGDVQLQHRVVYAPLTRFRATSGDRVPIIPIVKEHYSQRASVPGTLLITEAVTIHPKAVGYPNAPGIWSEAQIDAWKEIVVGVHEKGSFIYLQLWATGRQASPKALKAEDPSFPYVSSSDVPMADRPADDPKPRPLTVEEIKEYVQWYADAATNAVQRAGFDGVEIHGANGFLIEQFLKESINKRTDSYGGSPENRTRFALEVVDAVVKAVGAHKTSIRLSPWSTHGDAAEKNPIPTYTYLVEQLKEKHSDIAYLHVIEPLVNAGDDVDPKDRTNDFIRDVWTKGPGGSDRRLLSAGGYDLQKATALADSGDSNLIVFGRIFISNPDLPLRLKNNLPLTPYDRSTFYLSGSEEARGYTDYPFYSQ